MIWTICLLVSLTPQNVLARVTRSVNVRPCKPGQFMDKLLSQCADCSIACSVPTSNYCKRVCPGWSAISPSSTPPLANHSQVQAIVMPFVGIAIICSVLFAVYFAYCFWKQRGGGRNTNASKHGRHCKDEEIPSGIPLITLQSDDVHRQHDDVPPQLDDVPPQLDYVPSQHDDVPPQLDDVPPQLDDMPPQLDYVPSQHDDVPPQHDDVPPQHNAVHPQCDPTKGPCDRHHPIAFSGNDKNCVV